MATPMELSCWGGDWGLPSIHTESLIVMAYAKFSGAELKIQTIDWTWKTLTGTVPALNLEDAVVTKPVHIVNYLRKQKYNVDYDLTAKQGADTLAYIALLEEKLHPALLHTFWVDAENYSNVTRPWFASRTPFPLNFYLPCRQASAALNRILLTKGEPPLHSITEVEAKIYSDAKECLNLLSHRLGTSQYFFGNKPTSLDAFVFGFLAPLHKAHLPSGQLQQHLKQLPSLANFCDNIISTYFVQNGLGLSPAGQDTVDANLQKLTQLVNKESNLIEKMDDNLRSSPQHRARRSTNSNASLVAEESSSSTPA
ncbi:metaxin-3-like isoform X1 [Acipenser oxyrinchus oxyrinchus]|uniref:Metaxin n=1 Tax=Acipenser oxyrinchus oxyrinchus TaxID=40147 RepID=A0AAD8LTA0_ACIOX|nr:metaxin-3-like isoform X1 [Acipenser oxyrinchus oxyrinchus]KAK1176505.1 metaxin-3-like isoform X1 [Acipenser oxyrinchus oxyrinchus]